MKKILTIFLLCTATGGVWAANAHHKLFSESADGFPITPHAVLYSTYTQVQTDGSAAQYIELNSSYHKYGFTQVNKSTWQVTNAGIYEFCFSGIADLIQVPPADIEVWLRINNVDIPDSNTIVAITNAVTEMTVAVCLMEEVAANSTFNMMSYSADTDTQWLYTAAGTTPTRPATPSVILTVKKISGIE